MAPQLLVSGEIFSRSLRPNPRVARALSSSRQEIDTQVPHYLGGAQLYGGHTALITQLRAESESLSLLPLPTFLFLSPIPTGACVVEQARYRSTQPSAESGPPSLPHFLPSLPHSLSAIPPGSCVVRHRSGGSRQGIALSR